MIESFSLKNFKSINELITIDFTDKQQRINDDHNNLFKNFGEHNISRLNFFYGKNGAGKTSIFEALREFKKIVIIGEENLTRSVLNFNFEKINVVPFKICEKINYETFFSLTFFKNNEKYRYSIIYDSSLNHIIDEKLEHFNSSFSSLYSKSEEHYNNLTIIEKERLNSYNLETNSILSLLTDKIKISNLYMKEHLNNAYNFFDELKFDFSKISSSNSLQILSSNEEKLQKIKKQIKKFDLTVDDIIINVREIPFEDFKAKYEHLLKFNASDPFFKKTYEWLKYEYDLNVIHKNKALDFFEESSGTQEILNILFSIYSSKSKVWIIDNFENDIHAEAATQLIKYLSANILDLQIIFMTHELEFLNLAQIHNKALHYFVIRDDKKLSTKVINLSQFADLRNDSRNSWRSFYEKFRLAQYPRITLND